MKQIVKYLGNFGRYQALIYAMLFIPTFLDGNMSMVSSFMMTATNSRCKLPDFDNGSGKYDAIQESNLRSVYLEPEDEDGSDAYCTYCPDRINLLLNNNSSNTNCSDNMRTAKCSEFIYDHSEWSQTVATEFDTVCEDAWKMDLVKSLFMVGLMLSYAIGGSLADKFGRRPVFIFGSFMLILTSNLTPLAPNYYVYCVFVILNGIADACNPVSCFIVVMELIDGLPRTVCGIWFQGFYLVGYLYTGLMAYLINDWRKLMWACSAPTVLLLPLCWYFPESIRWRIINGRTAEAKKEIERAARMNRIHIPDSVIQSDFDAMKAEDMQAQGTIVDLFKHWTLAKTSLIVFFSWFVVSMTYFGLSLNADDLPGNANLNYALLGIAELPGYFLVIPMMEKLGRVPSFAATFGVAGICCILAGTLPSNLGTLIVTLAMIGKMCIATTYAIAYNYSAEVFPTVVRNAGTGFSAMCGTIGSIAAPQIHLLAFYATKWLPITIYGAFALAAAVADLFLPETRNRELPETIEDGINFARKSHQTQSKQTQESRCSTANEKISNASIVEAFGGK